MLIFSIPVPDNTPVLTKIGSLFSSPALSILLIIKSRKSVATFKLREGMSVGCKVTLRRDRMYEFLDRLINIALPQVRDFRGLSNKSFDGRGNYALGLREQIVFPEIDYDAVDEMRGMDIVIVTSAKTDGEAKALLKGFNMPIN